ncbi:MAG: TusE/DsrC/DsvC family sulfur relay protein [Gammaproteobacteria bacterium]|jgi:tRNA 2-thiouridine synthesizing protein E
MTTSNIQTELNVDREMFLQDFNLWNDEWADQLAHAIGYAELSEDQWKIIRALREYYAQHRSVPTMHIICKMAGLDHMCLDKLFHNKGADAWKIAGLPNPGEEIKAYL